MPEKYSAPIFLKKCSEFCIEGNLDLMLRPARGNLLHIKMFWCYTPLQSWMKYSKNVCTNSYLFYRSTCLFSVVHVET